MNLIGFIKHEIAKVVEMVENGAKIACFKLEMRGWGKCVKTDGSWKVKLS